MCHVHIELMVYFGKVGHLTEVCPRSKLKVGLGGYVRVFVNKNLGLTIRNDKQFELHCCNILFLQSSIYGLFTDSRRA